MLGKLKGRLFGEEVRCQVLERKFDYVPWHDYQEGIAHERDTLSFLLLGEDKRLYSFNTTNTDGKPDEHHDTWNSIDEGQYITVLIKGGNVRRRVT